MSDFVVGPAEAHGLLCGLFCGGPADEPVEAWLDEVLAQDQDADGEVRAVLRSVADRTCEELEGVGETLTPLLPPEDRPLRERAEAVYDWSRGFLYGLGLARVDLDALSPEAREGCDDFLAITELDLEDLEGTEENEAALTEVTELMRVATMLVYTDCVVARR